MLETVREYADGLLDADREDTLCRRAATCAIWRIRSSSAEAARRRALKRLDAEVDNIRVAWDHAVACDDVEHLLRLAAILWRYWWIRGHLAEGRARQDAAVAVAGEAPATLQALVLHGAAALAWSVGDYDGATALANRCVDIARAAGHAADLGVTAMAAGDLDRASGFFHEVLADHRAERNFEGIG